MNTENDYALALQLQEQFHRLSCTTPVKSAPVTKSNLGSPSWELTDPTPNIHALFIQFDKTFFWGKLASVVVRWSKRMYSCAGICRYEGRKGFCDIALSEPLLKLRPRKDLVETLLHEMIHAYLFLTNNARDRDGHGPNFLQHMHRINRAANLQISVYHDFIDEVHLYQTHWWRCNGPCQNRKPFFGVIRRSCNRAPGPSDYWWRRHQRMCAGKFIKIKEPEKKKESNLKKRPNEVDNTKSSKIMKVDNKIDIVVGQIANSDKSDNRSLFYSLTPNMIKDCNEILSDVYGEGFVLESKNFKSCSVYSELWLKASKIEKLSFKQCHICNKQFKMSQIEKHNNDCTGFEDINILFDSSDVIDLTSFDDCRKKEAFSNSSLVIDLTDLDNQDPCVSNKTQINNSLLKLDGLKLNNSAVVEKSKCNNLSSPVKLNVNTISDDYYNCPICNKQISRNNADEHLEECVSKTFMHDDVSNATGDSKWDDDSSNVHSDDIDETFEYNATDTKDTCPCCFFLVEETQMNAHLDRCLL